MLWVSTIYLLSFIGSVLTQTKTVETFFKGVCEEEGIYYSSSSQIETIATNDPVICMNRCKEISSCYLITLDGLGNCRLLSHLRDATRTAITGASSIKRYCKKGCHSYGQAIYYNFFNSPTNKDNPNECQEVCISEPNCIGSNYGHALYSNDFVYKGQCWIHYSFDLSKEVVMKDWMSWPRYCINDMNVTGNWISFGTNEYLIGEDPVLGSDAENQCQNHGEDSSLIVINDLAEMLFIQSVIHQMIMSEFIPNGINSNFFITNPKSVSSTNFEDRCSGGIPASAIPVLVSNRGYCMDRGSSGEENLYICERKLGLCSPSMNLTNGISWPSKTRFPVDDTVS